MNYTVVGKVEKIPGEEQLVFRPVDEHKDPNNEALNARVTEPIDTGLTDKVRYTKQNCKMLSSLSREENVVN